MATTTYAFFAYNNAYTYDKWDVIQGGGASVTDSRFFYSTKASNLGNYPLSRFTYTATNTQRLSTEVMRVSFTQTGTAFFTQGSMVTVGGVTPDGTANYTGTALGGGSGYVDFLCPGLTTSNAALGGTVVAPIHPAFTTGFWWIPSPGSKIANQQIVIESKLGEGYTQKYNPAINFNSLGWTLVYEERTDKEIRSLANFCQDMGGVVPIPINFPVGKLSNRNDLRYTLGEVQEDLTSFGLNAASVQIQQVFNIP